MGQNPNFNSSFEILLLIVVVQQNFDSYKVTFSLQKELPSSKGDYCILNYLTILGACKPLELQKEEILFFHL
jgi:hypothetical protein